MREVVTPRVPRRDIPPSSYPAGIRKRCQGDTSAFDRRILLLFRDPHDFGHVIGPPWLPEMMRDLTSLGSTVVLGLVLAIVAGYLTLSRKRGALVLVLAAVIGGQLISTVLKNMF